jgi:hypothetical protein
MRRKKEDYIVIALGIILVVIILVIAVITANFSRNTNQTTNETTPIPTAPEITRTRIQISPTPNSTRTRPSLLYDRASNEKLLDLMKNRRPISNADSLAKAKILTLLPQDQISGIVHETRNIRIDYVHSADLIQVEILTTDIKTARDEANVWLREQGLSQTAICTLPVNFYVSYDVANQLRDTNIVVSALGNGCL